MLTISEKDVVKQLERMNDTDSAVRRDAIESLSGIRDGRILYPLIKALQDEDQGIQQAAMDALTAFEDESAVYMVLPLLMDQRVHVRNMAREILEKIGGHGIELFGFHIKNEDEDVRKMIADILGNIRRPEAVNFLIEMLKDPCSNVRSSAAESLGEIGDSTAVEPLIDLLGDEEWVAFFAAGALGRLRDPGAVSPLIRLATSSKLDLQIAAVEALGEIGGEEAALHLMEIVNSVRPEVANTVIKGVVKLTDGNIEKAIEKFGKEVVFEHLVGAMNDIDTEDFDVKRDFIKAFSVINSPQSTVHILKLICGTDMDHQDLWQIATDALKSIGDEDTLIQILKDENRCCALIAVRVLGLLKSVKAVPDLFSLFETGERDLQIEILDALGRIGGRESLRFLIDMLSYNEGHIRGAVAHVLGTMADPGASGPLLDRLQQEEYPDVVEEIVRALVQIGKTHDVPFLAEGLASNLPSKKPYVREMLIKGLGLLGYAKAAVHAKAMLSDESWRVRKACLETLEHLNTPGLPDVLMTAASDETDEIRIFVAQLAGRHSDERSVDALISLLTDRNIRVSMRAAESLVRLKAVKAIPYLLELAVRGESSILKSSIWALGELGAMEAENIIVSALRHQDNEIREIAGEAYKKLRNVNNAVI